MALHVQIKFSSVNTGIDRAMTSRGNRRRPSCTFSAIQSRGVRRLAMIQTDVLLDAFTRVHQSLHRTLPDLSAAELIQEPHPPIGWLAWRISRVMDSNVSRLSGREQLWIGEGWAARLGMPPRPADSGP